MRKVPSGIAFTPAAKAIQDQKDSRKRDAQMERRGGWETSITPELVAFLADLDMFTSAR